MQKPEGRRKKGSDSVGLFMPVKAAHRREQIRACMHVLNALQNRNLAGLPRGLLGHAAQHPKNVEGSCNQLCEDRLSLCDSVPLPLTHRGLLPAHHLPARHLCDFLLFLLAECLTSSLPVYQCLALPNLLAQRLYLLV